MGIINKNNLSKIKRAFRPRIVILLLIVLLVTLLGPMYIYHTWIISLKETSERELKIARTAKAGLLQGIVRTLQESPTDMQGPPYWDTKQSLKELIKINEGISFAYIYTQINSKLYYIVGSEDVNSKNYLPPKKELTGMSLAYMRPFENGRALVTDPETFKGGTWVSVLVPIEDLRNGKVSAVLVLGYSQKTWNRYANSETLQAGTIVVAIFLLLCVSFWTIIKAEELLKAKKAAEVASVTKGQFLANMSHEIRTPINGIVGFLQLLTRTELDETQRDYVQEAISSSKVLLALINDILDFSKIEAGKFSMEKIKFNMRAAVEDAVAILMPKAEEKGLLMNSFIKANVPEEVIGDPARLRQVFNNLLSNAIKFTSQGEVTISIETIEEAANIATIRFSVTDTGIGISKEACEKLFKPFTQADSSTTRKYGGTGLGLVISKELVNMMDGEISVRSAEGKGSTFSFTAKFEIVSKSNDAVNPSFKKLDNMKVLVVDDNRSNQKITRSYLEEYGMNVFIAESGENAIAELLKHASDGERITIVICDYHMPGMNGYELAAAIKALPSIKNTPLILLTSVAQKGDAMKAKEKGFQAYLARPIKRDELISCVMMVTGLKKKVEKEEAIITKYTEKEVKMAGMSRILLAEDNIVNRKVIVAMLKSKGIICDIAEDGKQAYKSCLEKSYDIVFMDCQMPVMDGYQATEKIRNAEAGYKHTIIIAMTANAMSGDRERCLQAGMDDYISKPIDFDVMFKMIEKNTKNTLKQEKKYGFVDESMEMLIAKSGISREDAKEIFDDYVSFIPEVLKNIERAKGSDDFDSLKKWAHQLKGSSGNLRVNVMYGLAAKLELSALEKDKDNCERILKEIKEYLNS